jgi:hypothetical protein
MEVWRKVVGYEGYYEVSNFGRVRRVGSKRCLKPAVRRSKYKHVILCVDSRPKTFDVHRLVAIAFLGGPPSDKSLVAHKDGNGLNNRLANLKWATYSENSFDQVLHGTQKGKHYGRESAITDDQVIAIRSDLRAEKYIAIEYGLARSTVGQIRRRETYKHIPEMKGEYVPKKRSFRFTDDEIRKIRSDKRNNSEISSEIGCSDVTIWSIKNRKSYAHVSDEPEYDVSIDKEEHTSDSGPRNVIHIVGDVAMMELALEYTTIFDADLVGIVDGKRWYSSKGKNTRYVASRKMNDDGRVETVFLHRLLTNCPDGMVVDHINGDGLDNRLCNLRVVTIAQNNMNSRVRNDSQSGIKGAYYDKKADSYYSRIRVDGENIYLGTFKTAEEAAEAYAEASRKYHGEYGRTHLDG